ncbi:MAG TPA: RNA polymerase sigma factor [Acidimicrobiales bacterium]|nr:RNA polymerase sigma factor [Acidimicrobiales bacterium]
MIERDPAGSRHRRVRPSPGAEAEAFGALFDQHAQAVYSYCARRTADLALAEDLTSVVFLEAWRHRRRMHRALRDSPLPWLLGVARNVVRNAERSRRRYRAVVARIPSPPAASGADVDALDRVEVEHALRAARQVLGALSEPEREIVLLVLWSGLSYAEAAMALGVPVGTVRSRLSRARSKLGRASPTGEPEGEFHGPLPITSAATAATPRPPSTKEPA